MKKLICLTIALIFAITLVGCGGGEEKGEKDFEVDLTVMSNAAAYSQLCTIGEYPTAFEGHKITAKGILAPGEDGKIFYCAVSDGSGCCFAYLEVVLASGEFPEVGSEITVEGTLDATFDGYVKDYICGRLVDAIILE